MWRYLIRVADMAGSYAIPGVSVNGQDLVEVYEVAGEAVERARKGEGPTLIEARTYRFYGHSMGDEEQYRTSEEVEEMRTNHDPITTFQSTIMKQGWLTEEEDTEIQNEIKDEITEAVRFAEESPFPTPDNVTTDVLAPAAGGGIMRTLTFSEALREALHEEMERDETIFVIGEDVITHGGPYKVTDGIAERFPERIFETPIAEAGDYGRGSRCRYGGDEPCGRNYVHGFRDLRHGRSGQPSGKNALHDRWPSECTDGHSPTVWRRSVVSGAALADHGIVVHARSGLTGRRTFDAR